MEDTITYTASTTIECSQCGENYRMLNRFGLCAICYSQLDDDERAAMGGIQFQQQIVREIPIETTTTVYKPLPGLLQIVFLSVAVSAVVATAVAMFAPRLAGFVSQYIK